MIKLHILILLLQLRVVKRVSERAMTQRDIVSNKMSYSPVYTT